jgi:hypothetical protein
MAALSTSSHYIIADFHSTSSATDIHSAISLSHRLLFISSCPIDNSGHLFMKFPTAVDQETVTGLLYPFAQVPTFSVFPVDATLTHPLTHEVLLCNLPPVLQSERDLRVFVQSMAPGAKIVRLPGLAIVYTPDTNASARLCIFARELPFLEDPIIATCDSRELPIVRLATVPPGMNDERLLNAIPEDISPLDLFICPGGSAHLLFQDSEEADEFIEQMFQTPIAGKIMQMSRFVTRSEVIELAKDELILPIGGGDVRRLRARLAGFGRIFQLNVLRDRITKQKVAHVTFYDQTAACSAAGDRTIRARFRRSATVCLSSLHPSFHDAGRAFGGFSAVFAAVIGRRYPECGSWDCVGASCVCDSGGRAGGRCFRAGALASGRPPSLPIRARP